VAEEGRRGKVKEAEGKAKEGHTTQEVAPDVAGFRMKAQNAPETLFVAPSVRKECDGADLNFGYHSYCSPSLSQNILISYLHSDLLYLF